MEIGVDSQSLFVSAQVLQVFGCEEDYFYSLNSLHSILEEFASQITNDDLDINKNEANPEAIRRYLRGKASAKDARWKEDWWTPRGIHAVETFPNRIIFML